MNEKDERKERSLRSFPLASCHVHVLCVHTCTCSTPRTQNIIIGNAEMSCALYMTEDTKINTKMRVKSKHRIYADFDSQKVRLDIGSESMFIVQYLYC